MGGARGNTEGDAAVSRRRGGRPGGARSCPRLALTTGEPAGIGPDIALAAARRGFSAQVVVIGDPGLLQERARQLGADVELTEYEPGAAAAPNRPGQLYYIEQPLARPVKPGQPAPENAAAVLGAIDQAVAGCRERRFDAVVTGPVNKAIINAAGFSFSGHTEYIAALCDAPTPVMMLLNDFARVALVTTHLPLRRVTEHITRQRLGDVIRVVDGALRDWFRLDRPRLLVCGVNPHAGEQGRLGREEIEVVIPVLDELKAAGLNLAGPAAADTAFTAAALKDADAVIAMYHDQGLTALKSHGFGNTVNMTLGLPIIRTSVDHGTALDLAGSGGADDASLLAAVNHAVALVKTAAAGAANR